MTSQQDIIEKVQKLLRLSQSDNIHESSLAAARAQELIDKYKLDMMMIEQVGEEEKIENSADHGVWLDDDKHASAGWRKSLASVIGTHNHCVVYTIRKYDSSAIIRTRTAIIGRKSDAQVVRYMYAYLVAEIRRLAKATNVSDRAYQESFKRGAVYEISQRLDQARAAQLAQLRTSHSTALVKFDNRGKEVEQWVDDNMDMRRSRQRSTRHNPYGYNAGRDAASELDLGSDKDKIEASKKRLNA